jgi:DNA-binding NarL/FixJ family response regulator
MTLSQQKEKFSLLIVDDHELTRFTLKLLFTSQKHIDIVGIAANGLEAINLVKLHSPDVIILDLQMPLISGFTAAKEIKKITPYAQIIAYSSQLEIQENFTKLTPFIDYFYPKDIDNISLINLVNKLGNQVFINQKTMICS